MSSNLLSNGGWTALAAVAGFGAAIYTTWRTIRSADRARLRQWRAEAYVDALAYINWSSSQRAAKIRIIDPQPVAVAQVASGYVPPSWETIEARLTAFGSKRVFTATQRASAAHAAALLAIHDWTQEQSEDNRQATLAADQAAEEAEDALKDAIRRDLQGRGPKLTAWQPPQPTDRKASDTPASARLPSS